MNPQSLALLCLLSLTGTTAAAEEAADIWRAKCKNCHGDTGKGDTREGKKHKVPDMTTERWQTRHDDAEIKKGIMDGVKDTKMKGFKDKYSEQEIDALVTYVRSLRK